MPLILDHARQPPGGHLFPDPSGFVVRAKGIRELLVAIKSYRANNGFTAGNPAKELETLYASKYPWLVTKVGVTPEVVEDPVSRWLNRIWRSPPKPKADFCESEPQVKRMAICRNCEHYVPDHKFSADATRRITILGAGKTQAAGACRVHHWACGLMTWVDYPDFEVLVDGCWARLK